MLGSPADEWLRLRQLSGDSLIEVGLLRSSSSLGRDSRRGGERIGARIVGPYVALGNSRGLPAGGNDGSLWAGLGWSVRALAGVRADAGPLHLVLAPELAYSQNRAFRLPDSSWYAGVPASRSPFAAPWYAGPHSADLPLRMGSGALDRLTPGQSALYADAGPFAAGVATENEWWGPGVRNAIVLSDNAPGFPHAFIRTRAPISTRVGSFEGRWLVGGLEESAWFDDDPSNDLRSVSMLAVTWRPAWERGLTVGASRAVYAPARNWGRALADFYQLFADVGRPNARPATDSTLAPGRDQFFSLFGRWVFPRDGFELWGEWARAEQPGSVRDFLLEPSHSQGYTIGAQWLDPRAMVGGHARILTELTYLERSPTFRNRPEGWTYTSRAVVQGYTNQGQPLGAAIGSGGSSQYLELGWVRRSWLLGLSLERVRYNDDAYNARRQGGFCRHDVALLKGIRGAWRSPWGELSVEHSGGTRMSPMFRNDSPECLDSSPDDLHVGALRLTLSPVLW